MAFEFYQTVPMEMAVPRETIRSLLGATLFGYASYGLHKGMVTIREKTKRV